MNLKDEYVSRLEELKNKHAALTADIENKKRIEELKLQNINNQIKDIWNQIVSAAKELGLEVEEKDDQQAILTNVLNRSLAIYKTQNKEHHIELDNETGYTHIMFNQDLDSICIGCGLELADRRFEYIGNFVHVYDEDALYTVIRNHFLGLCYFTNLPLDYQLSEGKWKRVSWLKNKLLKIRK